MNFKRHIQELQAFLEEEMDVIPIPGEAKLQQVRYFLVELMSGILTDAATAQADNDVPSMRYTQAAIDTLKSVLTYLHSPEESLDMERISKALEPIMRGELPVLEPEAVTVSEEDVSRSPEPNARNFVLIRSEFEWDELEWEVESDAGEGDITFMADPVSFPVLASVEWLSRGGYYVAAPIFVYPKQARSLIDAMKELGSLPPKVETIH